MCRLLARQTQGRRRREKDERGGKRQAHDICQSQSA